MNELIAYILKASAGVAIVAIPYYLFLRNDSALKIKRLYLVFGILLSWLFPLISIQKPELVSELEPIFFINIDGPTLSSSADNQQHSLALHQLIYIIGIVILFVRGCIGLMKIRTFRKNSNTDDKRIYYTDNKEAFTFFRRVFMPKNYNISDKESILIHEQAHVRQMHFLDMLIAESNLLLTWFNPFSWLISRMIKENHEHLADRAVLSTGVHPAQYKTLLLNHAMGGQVVQFGHQFNHSLTKKRFKMMRNLKTTGKGLLKYLFIIPAILTFNLLATASCQNATSTIKGEVYLGSKDVLATGASVIIKNSTIGTVVDRKGEFRLEVEGNPDIVISFVGYETLVKKAKSFKSGPVVLQPSTFNIAIEPLSTAKGEKKDDKLIVKINSKNLKEGKEPVYIINGEVIENIDSIDPDDIKSINVIKDQDHPLMKKHHTDAGLIIIKLKDSDKEDGDKALHEVDEDIDIDMDKDEEVFFVVEDIPSFPRGNEALRDYIYSHVVYPEKAKDKKIEGKVNVLFTVTASGELKDISVMSSTNELFNDAAMAVFKDMPLWNPGKQRGKSISTKVSVPVKFALDQE